MVAVELVPGVADSHWATIVLVLTVEFAMVALEATYHGWFQLSALTVYPMDRPLALLQIERPERQAGPTLGWEIELIHRGDAAEVEGHA